MRSFKIDVSRQAKESPTIRELAGKYLVTGSSMTRSRISPSLRMQDLSNKSAARIAGTEEKQKVKIQLVKLVSFLNVAR